MFPCIFSPCVSQWPVPSTTRRCCLLVICISSCTDIHVHLKRPKRKLRNLYTTSKCLLPSALKRCLWGKLFNTIMHIGKNKTTCIICGVCVLLFVRLFVVTVCEEHKGLCLLFDFVFIPVGCFYFVRTIIRGKWRRGCCRLAERFITTF